MDAELASWLPVTLTTLVLLTVAAFGAGWIDAVVGGGGLIQLPALVIGLPQNLPSPYVLGTNKLAAFMGTFSASLVYLRRLRTQLIVILPLVIGAYSGSTGGAWFSRFLPREILTPVVLVAVVGIGVYILVKPRLGITHEPRHEGSAMGWRAGVIGLCVGFYDGLLGPGTGSFFVILMVAVLGFGFLEASVNAKIANVVTNIAAIVLYGLHGEVVWVLGLIMGTANILGAVIGARMAVRRGSEFVRKIFVVAISILALKLAWDTVDMFWL
ncbi:MULTISPECIES: TSUP family transporter [Gulosibacter]|uniref:TSUP family transporter n=1 Tax=Gulosibacter TaxID=256818 RepID=UPI000F639215|nr:MULTISPECIES: TSUP family transporter [Gulosibacter]